jgi:NitT/TauT family transport system permease protein
MFGMDRLARFWRIEVPFGLPPLIWNMMMSMSGGWFFVTLSEAISVGHTTIVLPGIGSYIAQAIVEKNLHAIFWAIGTMLIVILIYDQLLFRPLVAWADRFRFDSEDSEDQPESWVLNVVRRSALMDRIAAPFQAFMRWTPHFSGAATVVDFPCRSTRARGEPSPGTVPVPARRHAAPHLRTAAGAPGRSDVGQLGLGAITMVRVTP